MPRPLRNRDQLPIAEQLLKDGVPVKEVARRTGLDHGAVRRLRNKLGLPVHVLGPMYPFNDRAFSVAAADEPMAYWAGFLLADGSIYLNPGGGQWRLKLALSATDAAHVARFNTWLGRLGPVLSSVARVRRGGKLFPTASVEVSSDQLMADLAEWGVVPDKTARTAIPAWLRARHDLLRHYLRGYFDGDGHVKVHGPYPTKAITRVCAIYGHAPFLAEVATILATEVPALTGLLLTTPQQSRVTDGHRHIRWASLADLRRLFTFFYADATVYLHRKHAAFEYACTLPPQRPPRQE